MSALKEILGYYGMPEENIDTAIEQIAETYGACPYLDGVATGAEAVAELGNQSKEQPHWKPSEELTHAAYHYANNLHMKRQIQFFEEKDVATDFIAGAEWQKEQMMKDAVELRIVESFNPVGTENEKPHCFTALCYNAKYPDFYPITGQTIKVIPTKEIQQ